MWETQEQEQRQQGRGASQVRSAALHSPGENLQAGGQQSTYISSARDGFIFEHSSVTMSMRLSAPHLMLTSAPL